MNGVGMKKVQFDIKYNTRGNMKSFYLMVIILLLVGNGSICIDNFQNIFLSKF